MNAPYDHIYDIPSELKNKVNSIMDEGFKDIENVYIFVSDACRYDFGSERLSSFGTPIRTVAASTFTAPSFSSMISGVYPPRHGVFSWEANITQPFTLMHASIPGTRPPYTGCSTFLPVYLPRTSSHLSS